MTLTRALLILMAFSVSAATVSADVISTHTVTKKDQNTRTAVQKQLMALGLDREAAQARAQQMTDTVAAHFAARPESNQVVAGLHSEEVVLGTGFLVMLAVLGGFILQNHQ